MMSDLSNYHWGLKGLRSVVYVPHTSRKFTQSRLAVVQYAHHLLALRSSPAVLKMVYGMNDQVDVTEPFWPIYS